MPKLNQIVAIEKNIKTKVNREVSDLYKKVQKPELFSGLTRTYKPKNEDGDKLPSEYKKVQMTVRDAVRQVQESLSELFNVTGTKDKSNCHAKADVVVDGKTIIEDAPPTYLIFLEKQLNDLRTFVGTLPTLDPTEEWSINEATGLYATKAAESTRTKKVLKNHVKAPATDKHPAQVEVYNEDVVEGYWTSQKLSGSIPAPQRDEIVARIEKLQRAVKMAREEANTAQVEELAPAAEIMKYIFG